MANSQMTNHETESDTTLMDLIRVIHRSRKLIMTLTIGLPLIAAVIMFLTPNSYVAKGTILLEMNESPINLDFLGQFGSLAGLGQNTSTAEIYLAILDSRLVKVAVIDSLDLASHYEIEANSPAQTLETALMELNTRVDFNVPDQVTITVSTKDNDPEMAARITNAFLSRLAVANTTLSLSRSHRTRKMIEEALRQTEEELEVARISLGEFQSAHGVFSLDDQTKGTLALISQLQGKLLEAQTQRDALGGVLKDNSSGVRSLDLTISALQKQINRLVGGLDNDSASQVDATDNKTADEAESEGPTSSDSGTSDFILPLSSVPKLTGDYARLMMSLTILETKYSVLASQLEKTKIDESQSVPSFEILDRAETPFFKSGPNRKLYVLSALVAGLLGSILLAILLTDLSQRIDADKRDELYSMIPRPLGKLLGGGSSNQAPYRSRTGD